MKIVNLIGLLLVTVGGLLAIFAAPGPSYRANGHIQLGPEEKAGPEFLAYRIRMHYFQKFGLPGSFVMIAVGSAMQVFVAWSDL